VAKTSKPRKTALRSSEYEIRRPRVSGTDVERTAEGSKKLSPTLKSEKTYTLQAKSGKFIFKSPARSATSVESWSKAFDESWPKASKK
jgi:hypothetical protein